MLCDLCSNVYLDTSSSNAWMILNAPALDLKTVFERVGCRGPAAAVVRYRLLIFSKGMAGSRLRSSIAGPAAPWNKPGRRTSPSWAAISTGCSAGAEQIL